MDQTASDIAYSSLRSMVMEGQLRPGQKVSQRRLARQLGCSTLPVLEAMRRLESDGLLVKKPHHMARVRELSMAELEELYLIREGLESITARLCAARIEPADVEVLRQYSDQFDAAQAARDMPAMSVADVAIHRHIARSAKSPLIEEELRRLLVIERTAGDVTIKSWVDATVHSRHRALISAIAEGDCDSAEYLMKKHIQSGCRDVLNHWKANP